MKKCQKEEVMVALKSNSHIPEKLKDCLSSDLPIVFYGCGNQGFICEDVIANNLHIQVSCFAVSCGQVTATKWNTRLPVYSIDQLPYEKDKCYILLTMGGDISGKIARGLQIEGYSNVCWDIDWDIVNEALREVSLDLMLNRHELNIKQNKEFEYKGFRFINPYENAVLKSMFIREFENITAQRVFQEEHDNQIDSSYELEPVVLESGDIVIDCGANIGIFSALSASMGCRVYAFEPSDHIATYTKKVAELYPDSIKVITKALSDKSGTMMFMEADNQNRYSSDSSKIVDDAATEKEGFHNKPVEVTTIDELVESERLPGVDFIKADIEGAERNMLQGAKKTLKKYAPKLSVCTYHLPDDKEVLTKIILDANPDYEIIYKWDKLYAYCQK